MCRETCTASGLWHNGAKLCLQQGRKGPPCHAEQGLTVLGSKRLYSRVCNLEKMNCGKKRIIQGKSHRTLTLLTASCGGTAMWQLCFKAWCELRARVRGFLNQGLRNISAIFLYSWLAWKFSHMVTVSPWNYFAIAYMSKYLGNKSDVNKYCLILREIINTSFQVSDLISEYENTSEIEVSSAGINDQINRSICFSPLIWLDLIFHCCLAMWHATI